MTIFTSRGRIVQIQGFTDVTSVGTRLLQIKGTRFPHKITISMLRDEGLYDGSC